MEENIKKNFTDETKNWHSIGIEEVIRLTGSDSIKGLSEDEITKRLQTYGKNLL